MNFVERIHSTINQIRNVPNLKIYCASRHSADTHTDRVRNGYYNSLPVLCVVCPVLANMCTECENAYSECRCARSSICDDYK